jgi:hypothetical protein
VVSLFGFSAWIAQNFMLVPNNMTPEQQSFEAKWHKKIVRPKGKYYQIPIKFYNVTAALYEWDGDETIFAIMAEDYSPENKHWFTIHLAPEELSKLDEDFDIIEIEYE